MTAILVDMQNDLKYLYDGRSFAEVTDKGLQFMGYNYEYPLENKDFYNYYPVVKTMGTDSSKNSKLLTKGKLTGRLPADTTIFELPEPIDLMNAEILTRNTNLTEKYITDLKEAYFVDTDELRQRVMMRLIGDAYNISEEKENEAKDTVPMIANPYTNIQKKLFLRIRLSDDCKVGYFYFVDTNMQLHYFEVHCGKTNVNEFDSFLTSLGLHTPEEQVFVTVEELLSKRYFSNIEERTKEIVDISEMTIEGKTTKTHKVKKGKPLITCYYDASGSHLMAFNFATVREMLKKGKTFNDYPIFGEPVTSTFVSLKNWMMPKGMKNYIDKERKKQ